MTIPTNFRALCAIAIELWDADCNMESVISQMRAALVQPEPTDEAWQEFIEQVQHVQHVALREGEGPRFDLVECALALWREAIPPAPEPEPEEQVLARVEFAEREFNCPSDMVLRQYCDDWFYGDPGRSEVDPVDLCRGAIKLFAQIPAPIPLSERLPKPEDCDIDK